MKRKLAVVALFLTAVCVHSPGAEPPSLKAIKSGIQAELESISNQDPAKQHQSQLLEATLAELARIEASLEARNLDGLERGAHAISQGYLPPELAGDLQKKLLEIREWQKEELEKEMIDLRKKIDELVGWAVKVCGVSESVPEVETLLVEIAAIEYPTRQRSELLGQRYFSKVEGMAQAAQAWVKYLDFKKAGNVNGANAQLSTLSTSTAYPILTRELLESLWLKELPPLGQDREPEFDSAGFKGLDDLPRAITAVQELQMKARSPSANLTGLERRLLELEQARQALKAGDTMSAYTAFNKSFQGSGSVGAMIEAFREELKLEYVSKRVQELIEFPDAKATSADHYLTRAFTEALSRKEFEIAAKLAVLRDDFGTKEPGSPSYRSDATALDHYATALKFEKAEDYLSALIHYRKCVATSGTVAAPVDEALEAIERIGLEHPELLTKDTSFDRLEFLEKQIRSLRDPRIQRQRADPRMQMR